MLRPVTAADLARSGVGTGWPPYVFYIGGWEARKNLPFLVRGFAAAGPRRRRPRARRGP